MSDLSFLRGHLSKKRSILIALLGCGVFITLIRWLEERQERHRLERKKAQGPGTDAGFNNARGSIEARRVGVNWKFLQQLRILLPIALPGAANGKLLAYDKLTYC